MTASFYAKYIAAGSLLFQKNEGGHDLDSEVWGSFQLHPWRTLSLSAEDVNDEHHVPGDIQALLLKSHQLAPYAKLLKARWVRLDVKSTGEFSIAVRVYLLPDDVHRGTVDRANPGLHKTRQALLSQLDYSISAWDGLKQSPSAKGHENLSLLGQKEDGTEDTSLLELFNNIPSPRPDPDAVSDPICRDAMYNLLTSNVAGLLTELYTYQRSSAALMLQKEAQPAKVLDPRLRQIRGQDGKEWYWDNVSGTILSEPRHYDGISGGILAEEMGSGKTIICLALILASRGTSTNIPDIYGPPPAPTRPRIASLVDMAASCASRNAVPWRAYLDATGTQGWEYERCIGAIERHPGHYYVPPPEMRRGNRHATSESYLRPPDKIYLSQATLIVVPNNLVAQWKQEIQKHTSGIKVVVITKKDDVPPYELLLYCDIVLFSQTRFEMLVAQTEDFSASPLSKLHFKRCIIDEGHKLGNSKIGKRSNLLIGLDLLRFDSRWVVTGTPSHGLFGVDPGKALPNCTNGHAANRPITPPTPGPEGTDVFKSSGEMERKDLERIGSMASLFLKARPWANTALETGDTPADWDTYLMLPRHRKKSYGRWDSLKTTLDSLILRHRLHDIGNMLPPVDERIVVLDGSYQDRLSMNVFSMMIIFNSVQSQRTDMDYFFHPKQRRSLLQIVHNLKQSTFFGGSFFTSLEISKALETAEKFLEERKVPVSDEDEALLQQAIALGHVAVRNEMRSLSNQFHEMPISVVEFPGNSGHSWALRGGTDNASSSLPKKNRCTTSASLVLALQKLVYSTAGEPEKFNALLNGGFVQEGRLEKEKLLASNSQEATSSSSTAANGDGTSRQSSSTQTLAGNTKLGGDSPHKARSHGINGARPIDSRQGADAFVVAGGPLESTRITATVSAKMSYLLDQVVRHQADEKILIFYENENIAWYLASMLDVVSLPGARHGCAAIWPRG